MDADEVLSAVQQSMTHPGHQLIHCCCKSQIKSYYFNLQHENKREMVKFLIESQLVDCDERNEDGQTAVEYALIHQGDRELAKAMITAELASLSIERSFYVMIRRGSVPVYRLFLELRDLDEETIFQGVSNALIELNAQRVVIGEELQVFVQYHLASFAHDRLIGDVGGVKDLNEWRKHFDEIEEHWDVLKRKYSDRNYAQVDNEFLFRIKAIHNCLYFVKDKKFLKLLPIMEVTFSIAALVEVIEGYSGVKVFNFIINKVNVVQFIGTICRQLNKVNVFLEEMRQNMKKMMLYYLQGEVHSRDQLQIVWTKFIPSPQAQENVLNRIFSGLKKSNDPDVVIDDVIATESYPVAIKISSRDRCTMHRLKRIFIKTKQLYSVQKCLLHIEAIIDFDKKADSHLTSRSVQRLIQILGESIKSTKNSPNIPQSTAEILEAMMTSLFPDTNKYFREFFSHKYSLAKKLYSISSKTTKLQTLAEHLDFVQLFFAIVFICSLLEASRVLVGTIRRCRSIAELESLLQYVPDLDLLQTLQGRSFDKVQQKMESVKSTLVSNDNLGNLFSVTYLKSDLALKLKVVEKLRSSLIDNWPVSFQNIRDACQARTPIGTIHRMADCLLTLTEQREIYRELHSGWLQNHMVVDSMHGQGTEMLQVDNQVMAGMLLEMERKLSDIQDTGYVENTKRILSELGEENLTEEFVKLLNKQLARYYENIFFIDNKYMVIKKFFKAHKLALSDEKLAELRARDELELQQIYDELLDSMRQILKLSGISTVENLLIKIKTVPIPVAMALQSCQLELCEMLITVDYYGDNFYLLKQRLQMISGRNFRNYLAHNALSYNVLTSSGCYKEIINAVVMVNSKVQLFKKNGSTKGINSQFLGTKQLLNYVADQNSLVDNLNIRKLDQTCKADIRGLHCGIVPKLGLRYDLPIPLIVDPNIPEAFEIIKLHFPEAFNVVRHPTVSMFRELHEKNYETAFKIFSEHNTVSNSLLPQAFFAWDLIMDHLLTEMTDWEERDQQGQTVLHRLVLAGNHERVQLLLAVMLDVDVNARDARGCTPLDCATSIGCAECTKLLLTADAESSSMSRRLGIVCHLNDSLKDLFRGVINDFYAYAEISVRSNNLTAFRFLVESGNLRTQHLNNCLLLAAELHRYELVKFMLSLPEIRSSLTSINSTLLSAIRKRSWKVVKLLLKSGASPNWVSSDKHRETAFQLAVEANSRRIISQMGNIDVRIYKNDTKLEHPMQIAVRNRSPKMVAYLTRMGFSLLDSGSILYFAVDQQDSAMIEEIFAKLDAAFEMTKTAQDPIIRAIGGLLNRWRTLAYLEDSGLGRVTAVFRSVIARNRELLEKLLEKSRLVRSFQGIFLKRIWMFQGIKLVKSIECENVQHHRSILQECDRLMACWKEDSVASCSRSTIQINISDKSVRGFFIVVHCESPGAIIETVEGYFEIERVLDLVRKRLQHIPTNIYGTFRLDSDDEIHHFIINGKSALILQSSPCSSSLKSVVQFCNAVGETPLHQASYDPGNIDMLKLLLTNGANPLQFNAIKQTPMHLALIGKDADQAHFLLKYCIDNELRSPSGILASELPNNKGLRPLHLSAVTGKTNCVQLLIDTNVNLRAEDPLGRTAAFYATLAPYISILKMLLDRVPNLLNFKNQSGKTMVHFSALMINSELHQLIFQYKPDLCMKDNQDCTPLELAIGHKNKGWVRAALIYAKANQVSGLFSNLQKLGFPAFHLALTSSDVEIVRDVVEFEIEGTLSEEMNEHHLEKLKQLLTGRSTTEGHTPLHGAVIMQSVELTKFVLECRSLYNRLAEEKVNLISDMFDWYDKSPLDYAICSGKEDLVNELLKDL